MILEFTRFLLTIKDASKCGFVELIIFLIKKDTRISYTPSKYLYRRHKTKQNILPLQALANKEHSEATEEEDENENEDIEAILEEEFFEEEEEESEEEQEADAVDRIQNEISEKFDSETEGLQGVQVLIPLLILLNYMIA